ncbi:MAG: DUF1887 family protein, partial [Bacteroidales bacterium]|nr:DUF1887 family protein [Bacteroidales bacterium]
MSTFLVSIISEQSAPNFLFIKEFQNQVDKFLFLTTDAMEKLNKTKQICDAANIDKEKRIKTNINEDFLEQSINKLGKLPLSSDNHYLVNLTGGTKMMAIAVWRFFHQFKNVRFFYVPLNKGVYNELFDDKPAQTQHFTYNISLEEYLKIYDIRFECQPLLCRSAKIAEDIFNDVKA